MPGSQVSMDTTPLRNRITFMTETIGASEPNILSVEAGEVVEAISEVMAYSAIDKIRSSVGPSRHTSPQINFCLLLLLMASWSGLREALTGDGAGGWVVVALGLDVGLLSFIDAL